MNKLILKIENTLSVYFHKNIKIKEYNGNSVAVLPDRICKKVWVNNKETEIWVYGTQLKNIIDHIENKKFYNDLIVSLLSDLKKYK